MKTPFHRRCMEVARSRWAPGVTHLDCVTRVKCNAGSRNQLLHSKTIQGVPKSGGLQSEGVGLCFQCARTYHRGQVRVLAKLRHSQRMNDVLLSVWIITEKDGRINCAHSLGCHAGPSESCSQVASVLFFFWRLGQRSMEDFPVLK